MRISRPLLAALLMLCMAGGLAAASAVTPGGPALESQPAALEPDGQAAELGEPAADPRGGPAWRVRRYRSRAGNDCFDLGRWDGERFGRARAGEVQELPVGSDATCGDLRTEPALVSVTRVGEGAGGDPTCAVLAFVATPAVRQISAEAGDRSFSLRPDSAGSGVAVLCGTDPAARVAISLTMQDGTRRSI